eukprot:1764344-Prymnesium_polylepis.2
MQRWMIARGLRPRALKPTRELLDARSQNLCIFDAYSAAVSIVPIGSLQHCHAAPWRSIRNRHPRTPTAIVGDCMLTHGHTCGSVRVEWVRG